ncbi:MAG: sigma-54 dependent transcriptional regulator [Deltaproteobacteria bacterium]|jgi:DNA-binding NtrC family response regulator
MGKILLVDDESSILETLEMFLGEKGHEVFKAKTASLGLERFYQYEPDVVILDIRLPDRNGLDVLSQIQEIGYPSKVIMITAFQDMETTIEAMKRGGYDYIHKPLDADEVEKAVNRALDTLEVDRETPLLEEAEKPTNPEVIIGKSEKMGEIFKTIGLLCQNRATVLIQGETGTGKELIARVIHRNSLMGQEPFVTLDCSAVVETLLESELFGHEKGAFTGADCAKKGKIELAGKGILFLDEVGELPLNLQGKFLGFLQRREFMRVSGQQTIKSRCRILAATNRDLSSMVRQGKFKEDLYFRLKVITINVPPLSERASDIPHLVYHFLQKINMEMGTKVTKVQKGVMDRLMDHHWLGNVRELENVLVQAIVQSRSKVILLEEIDKILSRADPFRAIGISSYSLPRIEKDHIQKILSDVGWNRTKAAKMLGISLPTLRSKIQKYAIVPP